MTSENHSTRTKPADILARPFLTSAPRRRSSLGYYILLRTFGLSHVPYLGYTASGPLAIREGEGAPERQGQTHDFELSIEVWHTETAS